MIKDRVVRTAVVRQSHFMFFNFYFPKYVVYKTAKFQREIFSLTEQENIRNLFICGFRGCAKSTILTLSYPIWSILGKYQKKFIVIICQTQSQAKQRMMNLRHELEQNQLLKNDLGPFNEQSNEWGSSTLVFPNYRARVTVVSMEQSIRGLIHGPHRPDLIIMDDVEDLDSTRTKEQRDKTYRKFKGDIIPAGDRNTKLVIVGNLLHEDSLLMRIKRELEENILEGVFKEYPLINERGVCLWPGKYSRAESIEAEKKKVGSEVSWQREYLLRIVPDEEQVIHKEWINYYNSLPNEQNFKAYITVDLAIKKNNQADYTAIVTMVVYRIENAYVGYILPNPINQKMGFPKTVEMIKKQYDAIKANFCRTEIIVEEVGYQSAVTQQLENDRYPAEGFNPGGDKRSRLAMVSSLIQTKRILFPRLGAEDLINQMVNFGVERHDDLADAFSMAGLKLIAEGKVYRASDFIT